MSSPVNRRPDASMDLLRSITQTALDPDYRRVANRPQPPSRRRGIGNRPRMVIALVLGGLLVGAGSVPLTRGDTEAATERAHLIDQVQRAEQRHDQQQAELVELEGQVRELQAARGVGPTPGDEADRLALLVGTRAASGPGAVITLTDAPNATSADNTVTDQDLRQVVNGLWAAGAEAIAINGHRLSNRTAIRLAGSAVTVDYRSVTSPYRVEAIGDANALPARFAETAGGSWCEYLKHNYGIGYRVDTAEKLALSADPGLGVQHARVGEAP